METAIYILATTTILLGVKFLENILVVRNLKVQRELDREDIKDALEAINGLTKTNQKLIKDRDHLLGCYNLCKNTRETYIDILEETEVALEAYQILYGE